MKVSQQIVGVNQRLGNSAVPNMQGTTRVIFDTSAALATVTTAQTLTFFNGVSSRLYPLANVNSNKFEPGESLAIQGFGFAFRPADDITAFSATNIFAPTPATGNGYTQTLNLNFYIGNQRIIKDLDLSYSKFGVGEAYDVARQNQILRLETPIVIPPQIEFYATVTLTCSTAPLAQRMVFMAYGQGTLLNTKSTF